MSTLHELPLVKPSKYDGTIDPSIIKNWITEIENVCDTRVENREDWARYAKQNLIGQASDWYRLWNPQNQPRPWEDFIAALKHNFYPPDYTAIVCRAFERIACTTTVLDYNIRFAKLMNEVSPAFRDPEYRAFRYKEGLPQRIKMYICQQANQDLESLMRAAQTWEQDIAMNEIDANSPYLAALANPTSRSSFNNRRPVRGFPFRSSPPRFNAPGNQYRPNYSQPNTRSNYMANQRSNSPRQNHEPEPMDLSEIQLAPLGTNERNRLRERGLCFYCKTGRHLYRDCPKFVQSKNAHGRY